MRAGSRRDISWIDGNLRSHILRKRDIQRFRDRPRPYRRVPGRIELLDRVRVALGAEKKAARRDRADSALSPDQQTQKRAAVVADEVDGNGKPFATQLSDDRQRVRQTEAAAPPGKAPHAIHPGDMSQ